MQKPKETTKQNNEMQNKNKNNDKEYIMRKFFQVTDKDKIDKPKAVAEVSNSKQNKPQIETSIAEKVKPQVDTDLEKQESFFARLLSRKIDSDTRSIDSDSSQFNVNKPAKPNTPLCEVEVCGDASNDTHYSGSTINDEIDKSIALFDDDPDEVDRVKNMRKLLNSTMITEHDTETEDHIANGHEETNDEPIAAETKSENLPSIHVVTKDKDTVFNCSECSKTIPIHMVETHADYHLALKLRDEDRQLFRAEIIEKKRTVQEHKKQRNHPEEKKQRKPPEESTSRNDSVASVASFLVKIDDSIPTEVCTECGKRVPIEKLPEHSDFHEAQKLSRELNKKTSPLVSVLTESSKNVTSSSVKRKRKSVSPVKKSKIPKCKSIDSFFRIT